MAGRGIGTDEAWTRRMAAAMTRHSLMGADPSEAATAIPARDG